HPRVPDAELGTFAHSGIGSLWPRADDDGVNPARHRLQVVVARVTLDAIGVGIDREDLVATVPQPLVHHVAAVSLGFAGHARDRDPLLPEKLGRSLLDCGHHWPPRRVVPPQPATAAEPGTRDERHRARDLSPGDGAIRTGR